MFKPLGLFLGLRYVRSRHGNGFSSFISASSTIGIALGVMVLIVLLSAMNGFERELSQKLLSIVPHAEIISVKKPISDWPSKIKKILLHPQVISAAPVIKMAGMMQKGNQLKGLNEIRGVDVELEQQVSSITDIMDKGQWQDLNREDVLAVVIGSGIAKKLKAKVGDKVQLLLPRPNANNDSQQRKIFSAPLKRNVTIVGIFKFGGTIDDTLAYMSLKNANKLMSYHQGETQGFRLKIADVFQAPVVARQVGNKMDSYVYIYNWTGTQGHIYNDIQLVRMMMFIVLVLVIAVASFNIVSTLIMAVNDKKGDIAILITMGAKSSVIMTAFIIQGLINGFLGCAIGGSLGVYLALNLTGFVSAIESLLGLNFLSADVYFIDYIPTQVNSSDVYITVVTALIMSLIATIYPAWRATKVEPAQVLGQL
ncbi:MAG: lipoprotein-releasing ABC transporter permease subunit LolE [Colwellia sp.]|nr:lipoprotein-releasing ABC transporter permease subunit LolE [Colwellia sp.]